MSIIIVFNSRTSTLMLADVLKRSRIPYRIINTPRAITKSCGISVECDERYLPNIRKILYVSKIDYFKGVYKPIHAGYTTKYVQIYM